MKLNPKSFGIKLWLYFVLFAAIIFGTLWLLQTVFLQNFYNGMAINNIESIAQQIASKKENPDFSSELDSIALNNSLLIFVTDWQGNLLQSTDEHSIIYSENNHGHEDLQYRNRHHGGADETPIIIETTQTRNLNLPQNYNAFLRKLADSENGTLGYYLENSSTYVYGIVLDENTVLYISTALGAIGATANILRIQLIWVTLASLLIAFLIAFFISRRFARPVSSISAQAKQLADGNFEGHFEKGFCSELDELSNTLNQTATELAKTDNFRRDFLANVSHDLRTPLTMIRGYAEMVRDFSWEDEDKREVDLSVIIRESDRLGELVNDILEYSALQSEPQVMEFENLNISEIARDIITQFAPLCERGGYVIETYIEPEQFIFGDGKQLSRVLYNLIDNAVSHAGEKKRVQFSLKNNSGSIRIEIRDFGDGIPRDELPYIWERYFTLKQQKRNQRGSGLGLSISKEILTAHDAVFGVESSEGEGSVFWFELRNENLHS